MNRRKFLKLSAAPFVAALAGLPLTAVPKPKPEYFEGTEFIFIPENINTGLADFDINIMEEIAKATGVPEKYLRGDNHGS